MPAASATVAVAIGVGRDRANIDLGDQVKPVLQCIVGPTRVPTPRHSPKAVIILDDVSGTSLRPQSALCHVLEATFAYGVIAA